MDSDDVDVRKICLLDWYKEFGWPFLSYFLHVFINQFVIRLQLLFAFVPPHSDVNEVPVYVELH
jgi:hypothetical protein